MVNYIIMNHIIIFFESVDGESKLGTGNPKPDTGHRKPETGNSKLETFEVVFEGRRKKVYPACLT